MSGTVPHVAARADSLLGGGERRRRDPCQIKKMWSRMVDVSLYKDVVVGIRSGVPCTAAGASFEPVGWGTAS